MTHDPPLTDMLACQDVLARYASGADWVDAAMFADVFWDDARIDFGAFACDKQDFVAMVMAYADTHSRRWHHFGLPKITITGATARAELTCHAILRHDASQTDEESIGRYLVQFDRIAGEWRISNLVYLLHRTARLPVSTNEPPLHTGDRLGTGHPIAAIR